MEEVVWKRVCGRGCVEEDVREEVEGRKISDLL